MKVGKGLCGKALNLQRGLTWRKPDLKVASERESSYSTGREKGRKLFVEVQQPKDLSLTGILSQRETRPYICIWPQHELIPSEIITISVNQSLASFRCCSAIASYCALVSFRILAKSIPGAASISTLTCPVALLWKPLSCYENKREAKNC